MLARMEKFDYIIVALVPLDAFSPTDSAPTPRIGCF